MIGVSQLRHMSYVEGPLFSRVRANSAYCVVMLVNQLDFFDLSYILISLKRLSTTQQRQCGHSDPYQSSTIESHTWVENCCEICSVMELVQKVN